MKDLIYKEKRNERNPARKALVSALILILTLVFTLTSCGGTAAGDTGSSNESVSANMETTSTETNNVNTNSEMFTERDLSGEYDENSAVKISLSGSAAKASSEKGVSISGGIVTISEEGTYIISGSLSDGQLVVEADKTAKVQLVLDNASVTSKTSAAIYVKSADKVFVTSAAGTENDLSNGGTFTVDGDTNIDGAVFARDDLVFNGSGKISVTSPSGHGIVGKDDVKLVGGTIVINAERHGVQANDSIRVAEADVTIDAGKEGMESALVYIYSGDIKITAVDDGLNAAVDSQSGQSMDGGSDGRIEIAGGKLYITAGGDALDSNGSVTVSGGYTVICGPSQGDTSVLDYNTSASITGGTFIGTGGAGMASNFNSIENQGLIAVSVGNQSAGSTVSLKDSSGNSIVEVTPELDYAVVYISTEDVSENGTYTLSAGTYSETIEVVDGVYSSIGGGMGGRGGMHGGPGRDMEQSGEMSL